MKTFETLDELWLNATNTVLGTGSKVPSRDGHTREVLGYAARIADIRANFMFNPIRKLSPSYAAAELLWYLSGSDSIEMIAAYAPQYTRFSDDGKTAHGAYGHRWAKFDQLSWLRHLLGRDPQTRQAVLTMYHPTDLPHAAHGDRKDIPCTLSLQFIVRENKLNLITTMRSNDLWLGLPYDAWCFTNLQRLVADFIGFEYGFYQHQAASLHIYDRNEEKARQAVAVNFNTDILAYPALNTPGDIAEAVDTERHNREVKTSTRRRIVDDASLLGQVTLMAATKWADPHRVAARICNPIMRRYIDDVNS